MTVPELWLWLESIQRLLGTDLSVAVQAMGEEPRPALDARVGRDREGREVVILVYDGGSGKGIGNRE